MKNKKYQPTKKNGGNVPFPPVVGTDNLGFDIYDTRVLNIDVPCGHCIECCKQKAREWKIRMLEEIKDHEHNYFITLTFSNEELRELMRSSKLGECNALAAKAVRRHLERWRKDFKCQLKHWYVVEKGHENTERIHLHGILFCDQNIETQFKKIERQHGGWMCNWKYWRYGHVWVGDFCNARSIGYIVKYMTKIDSEHKGFYGQVLCSPGIGRNYTERPIFNSRYNYKDHNSITTYKQNDGTEIKNPTYYKNKAYKENEREKIWRDTLDTGQIYIAGNRYGPGLSYRDYWNIIHKAREINKQMGYGDNTKEWAKKEWNVTEAMLKRAEKKREELQKITEFCKKLQENLEG